jgi:hypothetical protein
MSEVCHLYCVPNARDFQGRVSGGKQTNNLRTLVDSLSRSVLTRNHDHNPLEHDRGRISNGPKLPV